MEILKYINDKNNLLEKISIKELIDIRTVVIVKTKEEHEYMYDNIIKYMKYNYPLLVLNSICHIEDWNKYKEETCIQIHIIEYSTGEHCNLYNIMFSRKEFYIREEYTIIDSIKQIVF